MKIGDVVTITVVGKVESFKDSSAGKTYEITSIPSGRLSIICDPVKIEEGQTEYGNAS